MREAQALAEARLKAAGIDSYAAEASLLLQYLCGLSRSELALARQRPLSAAQVDTLERWLRRRAAREPLQHIVGVAHFYGLELAVTPAVLIPRPETELLVWQALKLLDGAARPRVLDIGTGSGAIALAIKRERPDAQVMACDISAAALAVARANAARHKLEVAFIESDLLAEPRVAEFAKEAQLITANLPYLPESDRGTVSPEVSHDPPLALYGGEDGLALFWRCEAELKALLTPGAQALFELDPRNLAQASTARGWRRIERFCDLAGRARFLLLTR